MTTKEHTYPVFKANQVLTDAPLNEMFAYLDSQTRLTRTHLIGIGIVCGLEVSLDGPGSIGLTKGCGVTSQGYLVIEPADVDLVAVRKYDLPVGDGYPPFVEPGTDQQYDLWELFPDDEPDTTPLGTSGLVLEDKALVLFLELRENGLRDCKPNDCDDRGARVSAVVRRLLIDVTDLDKVIAAYSGPGGEPAAGDLAAVIAARLALPDLRMPRFDVLNTEPVSSQAVLAAFQQAIRTDKLATQTAAALGALYEAFKPLVVDHYPTNPFSTFLNRFGFLDASPATTAQVRFMQYYWDLFDDLLAAYDEVRWKGVDLLCACCPPEDLFPRHLMAGVLDPSRYADPDRYRHHFVRSPAVGDCENRTAAVVTLFRRLVEMVASFTDTPPLRPAAGVAIDGQIRVTPSRHGKVPLSAKAVPYYYTLGGTPPLHELWDPANTAAHRAHHNLGYRTNDYQPALPSFVAEPLGFELEPHNFLRIEGHLGKDYQRVLRTLLSLRKSRRLPIGVIALRAGAFDEKIAVDLSQEECRFDDLEALYRTLRSELICFLVKQVRYFYDLPHQHDGSGWSPTPSLPLLKAHAPDYRVRENTIGSWVEHTLKAIGDEKAPSVDLDTISPKSFTGQVYRLVTVLSVMADPLADTVGRFDPASLASYHRVMAQWGRQFETARRAYVSHSVPGFTDPGLADRLDDIVFGCRLDRFEALAAEYRQRVLEVKRARFLGHFLERHPGIQHKAGVPLGGTFILVYHELPKPAVVPGAGGGGNLVAVPPAGTGGGASITGTMVASLSEQPATLYATADPVMATYATADPTMATWAAADPAMAAHTLAEMAATEHASGHAVANLVPEVLARLPYQPVLATHPDIQALYRELTGKVLVPVAPPNTVAADTYLQAVAELADGTVIADFFLPYQCHSRCAPIQYQLPPVHLRVEARVACAGADGRAEVELVVEGATGSVSVQVDGGPFEEFTGTLLLTVGDHTVVVRDDSGAQSSPVVITVAPPPAIGDTKIVVDESTGTYQVIFTVAGGVAPYTADVGHIAGAVYTSPVLPVAEILEVTVTDAAGCAVRGSFESGVEPCTLPCDGKALRRGFRFWVPEPRHRVPLHEYHVEVERFAVHGPDGNPIDLTAEVNKIVNGGTRPISAGNIVEQADRWLRHINELVANAAGSDQWLHLAYEKAADRATTGTLWIDRLECIDLEFLLHVGFVQDDRAHSTMFSYGRPGTTVIDRIMGWEALIPPFDGSASDKCRPDQPPIPLCEDRELTLDFERRGADPEVVLTAVWEGRDAPAELLWEVQDGIPALSNREEVTLRFEPAEPGEKLVRLTAFTDGGCTVSVDKVIDISRDHG